jgi:hypothetical protein
MPLDPATEEPFVMLDLHEAAAAADVIFGYTRVLRADSESITVFFPAEPRAPSRWVWSMSRSWSAGTPP